MQDKQAVSAQVISGQVCGTQAGSARGCQLHFNADMQGIFRVNQAGENGAVLICMAMMDAINTIPEIKTQKQNNNQNNQNSNQSSKKKEILEALQTMLDQELEHQAFFTDIVAKTKTRPTIFTPLWKVGAYAISFGSAILGNNFAMNAIVAIEDAIEKHYFKQRQQLRVISDSIDEFCGIKIEDIIKKINQFEQEEVEHGNLAAKFVNTDAGECSVSECSVSECGVGCDAAEEAENTVDDTAENTAENTAEDGRGIDFNKPELISKLMANLGDELQSKKEKISSIFGKKAINLHYKVVRSCADFAIELSKRW